MKKQHIMAASLFSIMVLAIAGCGGGSQSKQPDSNKENTNTSMTGNNNTSNPMDKLQGWIKGRHDFFNMVDEYTPLSDQQIDNLYGYLITDNNNPSREPGPIGASYFGFIEGTFNPEFPNFGNRENIFMHITFENQRSVIKVIAHQASINQYRLQAVIHNDGTFSSFQNTESTGINGTFYGSGFGDSAIFGKIITPYVFGTYLATQE